MKDRIAGTAQGGDQCFARRFGLRRDVFGQGKRDVKMVETQQSPRTQSFLRKVMAAPRRLHIGLHGEEEAVAFQPRRGVR